MQRGFSHISTRKSSRGFSLVELIVSAAIMLLLATAFVGAYTYGEEGTEIAGEHSRAVFIAEEGIEAARNMRDQSFSDLVNGTYGVASSSGAWAFSGSSDTQDIFTRTVTISTVDTNTKQITSTVTWPENSLRTGTVSIVTYLTNTQLLKNQANNMVVNVSGAALTGSNKTLSGITLQNTGSSTSTITAMRISWQTTTSELQNSIINSTTVWSTTGPGSPSGSQSSGATITIQPYAVPPGVTVTTTRMLFSAGMAGNSFTITYTMSDGSSKTVTTATL